MHTRRAVRASPDGNVIVLRQRVRDHGRFRVPDIERHDRRAHEIRKIAVDAYAVHVLHALVKPAGQRKLVRADGIHARLLNKMHGGKQPRDAVAVARSGFEPCGILRRL